VAAAAAAGLLLTATGTIGGLVFGAWAAIDRLHGGLAVRRAHASTVALHNAIAKLPHPRRRIVETAYFGGLSHAQISRMLGLRLPVAALA
jgi:DNA-directed RNA polymerase specialized sigma24 family protein